jgi:predicted ABC-class ATPase
MKNSPFNAIFLAAVVVSSLWSVWLCYTVIARNRELRQLQTRFAGVNHNQQLLTALASDAVEYSKKNPAIDPLLESIGIKQRGTNAPTTSTSKPAGR